MGRKKAQAVRVNKCVITASAGTSFARGAATNAHNGSQKQHVQICIGKALTGAQTPAVRQAQAAKYKRIITITAGAQTPAVRQGRADRLPYKNSGRDIQKLGARHTKTRGATYKNSGRNQAREAKYKRIITITARARVRTHCNGKRGRINYHTKTRGATYENSGRNQARAA